MDLSILLLMPFPIEPVSPKWTLVGVRLVVSLAIQALEHVRAWFSFFCFQSWQVGLGICLAVPAKSLMVFRFVQPIAFDTFGILDSARECCMTSLPTIFALRYARVHVGSPNSCDIASDIETSIN